VGQQSQQVGWWAQSEERALWLRRVQARAAGAVGVVRARLAGAAQALAQQPDRNPQVM